MESFPSFFTANFANLVSRYTDDMNWSLFCFFGCPPSLRRCQTKLLDFQNKIQRQKQNFSSGCTGKFTTWLTCLLVNCNESIIIIIIVNCYSSLIYIQWWIVWSHRMTTLTVTCIPFEAVIILLLCLLPFFQSAGSESVHAPACCALLKLYLLL